MTSCARGFEFRRHVASFREGGVTKDVGPSVVEWAHGPGLSYIDSFEVARLVAELTIRSKISMMFIEVTLDAAPPSYWETEIQRRWRNPFPLGNAQRRGPRRRWLMA